MEIQRYEFNPYEKKVADGEFVRYDAHESILEAERARNRKLVDALRRVCKAPNDRTLEDWSNAYNILDELDRAALQENAND